MVEHGIKIKIGELHILFTMFTILVLYNYKLSISGPLIRQLQT